MYVCLYAGPLTEKIEQKSGEPGMQSCFHELNQTVKRYRNNKTKKILIPLTQADDDESTQTLVPQKEEDFPPQP